MATRKPESRVPTERANFNVYLLTNPNYYGNLKDSPFKKVVKEAIVGNTTYEQLTCLGFNPQRDLLEAVVTVKLSSGYGTDICLNGTNEYVRFYADYGAGWQDLGFSSVRVHDIPGPKPICYHAKISIDPPRKYCGLNDSLVKVRAILSWQTVPPPNTPDYPPVWGNVVDRTIQIRPTYKKLWYEIMDELKLSKIQLPKLVEETFSFFDPDTELAVTPKKLSLEDKISLYQGTKVGVDRFAHDEVEKLAHLNSVALTSAISETPLAKLVATKQIDVLLKAFLSPGDGNTTYEELRCVGYRPEDNTVTAVLTVKQGGGYSGRLCTNGSTEYVAFYFSPNNDGNFFHLGTAGVQVHDLLAVPADGVQYSITMPVEIGKWLKDCDTPVVGMLRGILRWGAPPPPNQPDYTPYWGNREECLMQLAPGDPGDVLIPSLLNISDVPADAASINAATGLAIAGERPFGGIVAIRGRMAGFIDREYRIEVRNVDTGEVRVLGNEIDVFFAEEDAIGNPVDCIAGGVFNFECVKHVVPVGGWYPYPNRMSGGGNRTYLTDNTLGFWHTSANDEGRWEIKATFRQTGNPLTEVDTQTVVVRIDNTAPTVFADFTGLGQCGKFKKGDIIHGSWSSHDPGSSTLVPNPALVEFQHWSSIHASIIPALGCGPVDFDGTGLPFRAHPPILTTGGNGTWTVDTSGCQPCGYAIRFVAYDRTIYGYSGGPTFYVTSLSNEYDLGYCLD